MLGALLRIPPSSLYRLMLHSLSDDRGVIPPTPPNTFEVYMRVCMSVNTDNGFNNSCLAQGQGILLTQRGLGAGRRR